MAARRPRCRVSIHSALLPNSFTSAARLRKNSVMHTHLRGCISLFHFCLYRLSRARASGEKWLRRLIGTITLAPTPSIASAAAKQSRHRIAFRLCRGHGICEQKTNSVIRNYSASFQCLQRKYEFNGKRRKGDRPSTSAELNFLSRVRAYLSRPISVRR